MIVLLSPSALKSQWVFAEIGAFWASTLDQPSRAISPVTIGLSPADIPELIGDYQAISFTGDDAVASIAHAVSARAKGFYGSSDMPPQEARADAG
jgi:hypothetical protein